MAVEFDVLQGGDCIRHRGVVFLTRDDKRGLQPLLFSIPLIENADNGGAGG